MGLCLFYPGCTGRNPLADNGHGTANAANTKKYKVIRDILFKIY